MQKPGPELILDTNAEADVLSKCCSDDKMSNKFVKSVKNYLKTVENFEKLRYTVVSLRENA